MKSKKKAQALPDTRFIPKYQDNPELSGSTNRTLDAKLGKFGFEGGRLETQYFSGTVFAADQPACSPQNFDNVVPFDFLRVRSLTWAPGPGLGAAM